LPSFPFGVQVCHVLVEIVMPSLDGIVALSFENPREFWFSKRASVVGREVQLAGSVEFSWSCFVLGLSRTKVL